MIVSTTTQRPPQEAGDFATFLDAGGATEITVPGGDMLLFADYARDGDDLVLTGTDGDVVVVLDYFAGGTPPALATDDGAVIAPDLALALAGETPPVQFAQASGAGGAQAVGRVVGATGNIVAARAGGGDEALDAGDPVFKGDVLQTGPDGTLEVEFEDGSKLKLSSNARMVVDDLVYDPGADQGSALFSLVQGTFGFESGEIAKTGPDAIQIRTPVATIGIRGTVLLINVDQSGNILSVTVVGDSGSISLIDPVSGSVLGTLTGTTDGSQPNTAVFSPGDEPTYQFIAPQDLGDHYGQQGVEQAAALLDTQAGPQDGRNGNGDVAEVVVIDPQGNFTLVTFDELAELTTPDGRRIELAENNNPSDDSNLLFNDAATGPASFTYVLGGGGANFQGDAGFNTLTVISGGNPGPFSLEIGQDQTGNLILTELDNGEVVGVVTSAGIEELVVNVAEGGDNIQIGPLGETDLADTTVFVNGGDGDDLVEASTTDHRLVADGGLGNDVLLSGSANDELTGGGGADVIAGGGGNDTIGSGDAGPGDEGDVLIGDGVDVQGTYIIQAEFLSSLAGFRSSFGVYYTDANGEPVDGQIIWADVKQSGSGPEVIEAPVSRGTPGFFLIPDGADANPALEDGTEVTFQLVDGVWTPFVGDEALSGDGAPALFDDASLNPGGTVQMLDNPDIAGNLNWEDIVGGGDGDFNDVNIEGSITFTIDPATIAAAGLGQDVIAGGGNGDVILGDFLALDGSALADYQADPAGFDFRGFVDTHLVEGGSEFDPTLRAVHDQFGAADSIDAGGGNDLIFGQGGNDAILAGAGDDTVFGGSGDDTIDGDLGNDRIGGGQGVDVMTGGADADAFVFASAEDGTEVASNDDPVGQVDSITDFESGIDTIELGDGFGDLAGTGTLTDGTDFEVIAGVYDGTNGTSSEYAAGRASVLVDGTGNVIYDANGAGEGYTILANVGDADVAASDVTSPGAVA